MTRLLTKDREGEQVPLSRYGQTLASFITLSLPLEDWLVHLSALPPGQLDTPLVSAILASLRRVSDFLHTVFCAFVIRDLESLFERYLKKAPFV